MKKPSMLVIFLTVFIDLVGFGVVVPLVPLYSRDFGAQGFVIGVIFAAYSAMQFVFAPVWGRLSDRHGRRPILLLSTAGACLSYVLFALASGLANHTTALWLMILSRLFAGICGGNITVAQAYIADITPPEDRSKRMGLIGMAFGLGFIFGPIFGGLGLKFFGLTGPGWIASAICAANFIVAFSILAESLKPTSEHVRPRPHLEQWFHTLSRPQVGLLVIIFFLATFCFSCFETTLPLLVSDHFHLNIQGVNPAETTTIVYLFAFCGIIGAVVQGGAIGPLVKRCGEPRLIALSLVLTGLSLVLLPYLKGTTEFSWTGLFRQAGWPWAKLLFLLAILSVGTSLTRPPVFGMISNLTPADEQGATIGVAQGAGSLARILGPVFAAAGYAQAPAFPYLICGAVAVGTGILAAIRLFRVLPPVAAESKPAAVRLPQ